MDMAITELIMPKELISEATQTMFRDSESQYLNCDILKVPTQHLSKFPRGKGLHYPILYDPGIKSQEVQSIFFNDAIPTWMSKCFAMCINAWPVHIAARKQEMKLPILKEKNVIGSYALKGLTLSETKRRPIKKTILFPHRNIDLPFRRPIPRHQTKPKENHFGMTANQVLQVVKEPAYERCESLTLQAIEELELHITYKSVLEKMPQYDVKDKIASALAIRKFLSLGPAYIDDPRPPIPRQRKSKYQQLQTKAKGIQGPLENENCEPHEIIFVDEGQRCGIHGVTIDVSKAKNSEIHGVGGINQEDEKNVLEEH